MVQIIKEEPDPANPGDRYTLTGPDGRRAHVWQTEDGSYRCTCHEYATLKECHHIQLIELDLGEPY